MHRKQEQPTDSRAQLRAFLVACRATGTVHYVGARVKLFAAAARPADTDLRDVLRSGDDGRCDGARASLRRSA